MDDESPQYDTVVYVDTADYNSPHIRRQSLPKLWMMKFTTCNTKLRTYDTVVYINAMDDDSPHNSYYTSNIGDDNPHIQYRRTTYISTLWMMTVRALFFVLLLLFSHIRLISQKCGHKGRRTNSYKTKQNSVDYFEYSN